MTIIMKLLQTCEYSVFVTQPPAPGAVLHVNEVVSIVLKENEQMQVENVLC